MASSCVVTSSVVQCAPCRAPDLDKQHGMGQHTVGTDSTDVVEQNIHSIREVLIEGPQRDIAAKWRSVRLSALDQHGRVMEGLTSSTMPQPRQTRAPQASPSPGRTAAVVVLRLRTLHVSTPHLRMRTFHPTSGIMLNSSRLKYFMYGNLILLMLMTLRPKTVHQKPG